MGTTMKPATTEDYEDYDDDLKRQSLGDENSGDDNEKFYDEEFDSTTPVLTEVTEKQDFDEPHNSTFINTPKEEKLDVTVANSFQSKTFTYADTTIPEETPNDDEDTNEGSGSQSSGDDNSSGDISTASDESTTTTTSTDDEYYVDEDMG